MSKAKHTKGPWKVCDDRMSVHAPKSGVIVATYQSAPIEYNQPDFSIHDDEQLEANASLIAAAPELYAFAEAELADQIACDKALGLSPGSKAKIKRLQSLLKKARGE